VLVIASYIDILVYILVYTCNSYIVAVEDIIRSSIIYFTTLLVRRL
jgi:hypothetical protein